LIFFTDESTELAIFKAGVEAVKRKPLCCSATNQHLLEEATTIEELPTSGEQMNPCVPKRKELKTMENIRYPRPPSHTTTNRDKGRGNL
jgi:hypothetical protein